MDLEYFKFAEFKKANPPSFRGAFNPDKAKEWIKAMKKVFSILAHTNNQSSICYLHVGRGCQFLVERHETAAKGVSDSYLLGSV